MKLLTLFFSMMLTGVALIEGRGFNNSLAQFFSDQAVWREWSSVSFVISGPDREYELAKYMKVMSKHFIMSEKILKPEPRFSTREGTIFIESYSPHYQIISAALIFAEESEINVTRKYLNNYANNSVTISSDIVLASPTDCSEPDECGKIRLAQVFKVAASNLTSRTLGLWAENSPIRMKLLAPESRFGNKLAIVRVGIKNASAAADEFEHPTLQSVAEKEEEVHLINLLKNVFAGMNVSYELIEFPKLGWKNDEGTWTHLLGAVSDGFVHVAADTIDLSTEGVRNHMMLTNPIIQTISAVYLRLPVDVHLKDVVMGTFSPNLQLSVLVTGLLLTLAMLTVTLTFCNKYKNARLTEPSEAILWTLGVLCMQGSPWAPKSLSGCALLLMSLMFAMIIYNSFAAFITSLLSVNDNPFRTIDDLLKTPIMFGYVEESQEEHFLRTDEDASLRALYYRGLVGDGGVEDVAEGMCRAASADFALFATGRLARRTLHAQISSQWRCKMMELPVASTKTAAAIPLASNSPYNGLINFWLIRIRETGILARIQKQLLPPMPNCIVPQTFHGATLGDLRTAFGTLILGHIAAVVILVMEILWARKKSQPIVTRQEKENRSFQRLGGRQDIIHQRWLQSHYMN